MAKLLHKFIFGQVARLLEIPQESPLVEFRVFRKTFGKTGSEFLCAKKMWRAIGHRRPIAFLSTLGKLIFSRFSVFPLLIYLSEKIARFFLVFFSFSFFYSPETHDDSSLMSFEGPKGQLRFFNEPEFKN